jgi:excisionase family DNA binding protein
MRESAAAPTSEVRVHLSQRRYALFFCVPTANPFVCGEHEMTKIFLTRREAALATGLSERTLFSLTKSGKLPAVRIGGSVRYRPADLEKLGDDPGKKHNTN